MFLGRANWPQVPECRDGPRGGMTRLFPHTLAHVVDRPRVANPEDLFSAEIRARSRTTPARESHQPPHCAPQAGQGRSLAVLAARRGVLIANTLGARHALSEVARTLAKLQLGASWPAVVAHPARRSSTAWRRGAGGPSVGSGPAAGDLSCALTVAERAPARRALVAPAGAADGSE